MKPDHEGKNDQGNSFVEIIINGDTHPIHRGNQSVEDIKKLAGVPLAHDLNLVVDGKLDPLADNNKVTIKGGEQFVSHPKDGSSS